MTKIIAQLAVFDASQAASVAVVLAITFVVTLSLRPLVTVLIRRMAQRSQHESTSRWRIRDRRMDDEATDLSEERRQKRIEAAGAMLARLASVVIWIAAVIAVLHNLNVSATLALSGAGFLGAGIAIGGQHSVNDFLTGIHILIEDRFGEGDVLKLRINETDLFATVVALGAFSARLESDLATVHVPNRDLATVINLSQRGITTELTMSTGHVSASATTNEIERLLRSNYRSSPGYDSGADGLVVQRVKRHQDRTVAIVRTVRPLTEAQRKLLSQVNEQADG